MCRSVADIQSTAAEIRRGKKEEERKKKERRKKLQGKNIMAPLLHRAATITISQQRFDRSPQNFGMVTHFDPVDQDGGGRHVEKSKIRHISATV